ncbi:MAG: hypothetical protein Q8N44_07575, partial [Rubrivivax sp.]|nr:hypothetical protein [Rubrivivax sp.]
MLKKRLFATVVTAFLGMAAAVDASTVGAGSAPRGAVIGQPLDLLIALRLEAGEVLRPDCLTAEVTVGDQRLPPAQVRAVLENGPAGANALRVRTLIALEEPVVEVNIIATCAARLSRRFILFAEPRPVPAVTAVTAALAGTPPLPT